MKSAARLETKLELLRAKIGFLSVFAAYVILMAAITTDGGITNRSVVNVKLPTTFSNVVFAKFNIASNANRGAKRFMITIAGFAMLVTQAMKTSLFLTHRKARAKIVCH